jgi:hypothetical protein
MAAAWATRCALVGQNLGRCLKTGVTGVHPAEMHGALYFSPLAWRRYSADSRERTSIWSAASFVGSRTRLAHTAWQRGHALVSEMRRRWPGRIEMQEGLRTGDPAAELARVAGDDQADLLVVGCRGRGDIRAADRDRLAAKRQASRAFAGVCLPAAREVRQDPGRDRPGGRKGRISRRPPPQRGTRCYERVGY